MICSLRAEAMMLMDGESRRQAFADLRKEARDYGIAEAIPGNWTEYLAKYSFPYPEIAERISQILQSPGRAHPVWFCEAILAVKRAQRPLDPLTYEVIRDAITEWRESRSLQRQRREPSRPIAVVSGDE
jgi:hypothetical protein